MPSTFSTNLKIELMSTGENSGTWGTVTNTNLGTALEQAVVGYGNPNYSSDANLTITLTDSNAAQAARALVLNVTSSVSLTGTRELVVPTIQKQYIVQNNTTGSQSITVKTSAGTGVTIPNGKKMHVYVDGTNVVQMDDFALIFNVDNLTLDGNTLSSTDTNGNIVIAPNGTGDVQLDADTVRVGDSNANATITTNGTGDLILNTNAGTNSGSITIEDGVNGNIIIAPNGTGQVQITNAALDLTTIEVSNINAKDGTAAITIADSTGAVGISTAVTMSATTQNIALGTSQTTGTFTVGGASQTGALTLDQSTKTHTLNLGTGATENALTKTINIGTAGVSGSTTAITIGSANGTTTTLNGTVTAATFNSTTIDTTNIEVTNIKAKDGTAALSIADSTGAVTVATALTANGGAVFNENGADVDFRIESDTDTHCLFVDASANNVGIGTNSPAAKLQSSAADGSIIFGASGTTKGLRIVTDSTSAVIQGIDSTLAASYQPLTITGTELYFRSGSGTPSEKMRLNSSGNLGIGETNPTYKLEVNGGASDAMSLFNSTNANGAHLRFAASGTVKSYIGGAPGFLGSGTADDLGIRAVGSILFATAGSGVDMTLDSSGNLGIGTNSPAYRLDVSGQARALEGGTGSGDGGLISATAAQNGNAGVLFQTNSASRWNLTTQGTNGANLRFYNYALASTVATFDSSGNLGLGVTPSAWGTSSQKAIEVILGALSYRGAGNTESTVTHGAYYDGTNWKYAATSVGAARYQMIGANAGSSHTWSVSAGGTKDNTISFTQAMTLDASGRLGVGETNPQSQLSLTEVTANTTTRSDQIRIQAESSGTTGVGFGANIYFVGERNGGTLQAMGRIGFGASTNTVSVLSSDFIVETASNGTPAERMRLDSSGNLGLGVTPSAWRTSEYKAVQVGNGASFYGRVTAGDEDKAGFSANAFFDQTDNRWEYIATDSASRYDQIGGGHYWFTAASGTAGNAITFTQAMTLDASGNLGIGQTNPSTWLVNGLGIGSGANDWGATIYTGTASTGYLCFADGATGLDRYRGYISYAHATNAMIFGTDAAERARIDSGGNWLVGSNTTTPQYGGFAVRPSGNNGSCLVLWNKDQATSSIAAEFRYLGVASGSITYTNTAVAYNTSSDYRLKDNQQPLTGSGDFIDALKPKTWNWKSDGSKGVGFVAHEVQAVSPGSVVGEKDAVDEDGNPIMQAMEYGSAEFIANIIAELQSLRARVAQLEGK